MCLYQSVSGYIISVSQRYKVLILLQEGTVLIRPEGLKIRLNNCHILVQKNINGFVKLVQNHTTTDHNKSVCHGHPEGPFTSQSSSHLHSGGSMKYVSIRRK